MRKLISLVLLMMVIVVGCKKDDPVISEYIVTFNTQGGSYIDALKVVEGQKVTKPQDPTKENFIFSGWYKEAACTTIWDFEKETVMSDVTLYAKWIGSDQKTYTVTFETNGGSEIKPVVVVEGETVSRPTEPSKGEYVFGNWYTDSDLSALYDFTAPVTRDMTLYAKWTATNFKLTDFQMSSGFESSGIVWDEASRTFDITNATSGSELRFNIVGASSVQPKVEHEYDMHATSIGGNDVLNDILKVSSLVDGKIAVRLKVPAQSVKVPLDIRVTVRSFDNENEFGEIIIKSRPDYPGTNLKPVLMENHKTGKKFFWAPVNQGATKIPTLVLASGDITESCGRLYQWGRKYGFNAVTDATVTQRDTTGLGAKGYPVQSDLADMSKWDGVFIHSKGSAPNTQNNWLLINGAGRDNPAGAEMQKDEWYQRLWNANEVAGTETVVRKTSSDPCPEGWRVPTLYEWQAIGADNSSIKKEWDNENKILTIAGAESGQKLVLSAGGNRQSSSGVSDSRGASGNYWSSSVPSGSPQAYYVGFNVATLYSAASKRAHGFSVRCVQE
ncbi:MAG: hypothetical protein PARBA_02702 [Parabacteroides sp.]